MDIADNVVRPTPRVLDAALRSCSVRLKIHQFFAKLPARIRASLVSRAPRQPFLAAVEIPC
jgi:hypothetical protein